MNDDDKKRIKRLKHCVLHQFEKCDRVEFEWLLTKLQEQIAFTKAVAEQCERVEANLKLAEDALEWYADSKSRSGLRAAVEMGLPHDCFELDAEVARTALAELRKA